MNRCTGVLLVSLTLVWPASAGAGLVVGGIFLAIGAVLAPFALAAGLVRGKAPAQA